VVPLILNALLYVIMPLWLLSGFTDYVLHRRTQIEHTAGTRESLLHLLQLSEIGLPILLGLMLEINSLLLIIMMLALMVHEATALYDVHYALLRRYVGVLEQHVHSFMEIVPYAEEWWRCVKVERIQLGRHPTSRRLRDLPTSQR
jgi:hypothetical protein